MSIINNFENELNLLNERINEKGVISQINKILKYCKTKSDVEQLIVIYRHYLSDVIENKLFEPKKNPFLNRPIIIGYLLNEDHILFDELDTKICNYFRYKGVLIVPFKVQDFYYQANKDGFQIYINNEVCKFDGFFSYGYRKNFSMDTYMYISTIMQANKIVCLHDSTNDRILNNKLLQSINFAKAKIPIPDTYQTFEINSTVALCENFKITPCVAKTFSDYSGDGVVKLSNKLGIVNTIGKTLWKNEHLLLQKFVPDSFGRSIRVLCFNNKAFTIVEYNSNCGDIRSNIYDGDCIFTSFMSHKKFEVYKKIAEDACNSVGVLTIAGVDLLDSEIDGIVVLEINSWPEMLESWSSTGLNTIDKLTETFIQKIENSSFNKKE